LPQPFNFILQFHQLYGEPVNLRRNSVNVHTGRIAMSHSVLHFVFKIGKLLDGGLNPGALLIG